MNRFGTLAMKHWKDVAPDRYKQIPDPTQFFSDLGDQVQEQIMDLADQIAGPDLPGEGYLGKVGRLSSARMSAEEIVLAELVWIYPEEPEEGSDTPCWIGQMDAEFTRKENDEWNLAIDEEYRAALAAGKLPFKS